MSYQVITDFRQGLDARKYKLALPPGTLLRGDNGHITQGGEFEKRKAFVPLVIPVAYTGIHFGLQPASLGLFIFGSKTLPRAVTGNRQRTANVATLFITTTGTRLFTTGDVVNISGIGGAGYNGNGITLLSATNSGVITGISTQTITYASVAANEGLTADANGLIILQSAALPSPLVFEALPNPGVFGGIGTGPHITDVVSSTVYGGAPFGIAQYDDGTRFPFYGAPSNVTLFSGIVQTGAAPPLADSYVGMQLALYPTIDIFSGQSLLKQLAFYINNNITNYTTNYVLAAGNFDLFSVPSTLDGTPYTVAVSLTSAAGTLTAVRQTNGQASTAEAQAVGSFQIVSAGTGTQATGTITTNASGTNISDGDTFTIGTTVYRFKAAMALAYDVKIGATKAITLASFAAAINGTGVTGTDYFAGTVAHPTVRCTALNVTVSTFSMSIAAITGGTAGNGLAFTSTAGARLVASAATLVGAVDSKINQIVVNGATNLLAAPVSFITDEATTAAAVATAINALPASGYQATSQDESVTILAQVAGTAPNGRILQVQAQGTIVCGSGAFSLTGSGFTVDFCKANGVDLMSDSILLANEVLMTYPQVPNQVLADFCRAVANNLNAGTATHGYLAHCPQGSVSVYLCKATTTSTDKQQVLDVSVTVTGIGQTGSVIPVTVTPLSVSLDTNSLAIAVGGKSGSVTAMVRGGVAPFTYRWTQQGSNAIGVKATSAKSAQTAFSSTALNTTLASQLRIYNRLPTATQKADYLSAHPALRQYLAQTTTNQVTFICTVADAVGQQAQSDPVFITLLGITQ